MRWTNPSGCAYLSLSSHLQMKYEITLTMTERMTFKISASIVITSFPPEVHSIDIISHNRYICNINKFKNKWHINAICLTLEA